MGFLRAKHQINLLSIKTMTSAHTCNTVNQVTYHGTVGEPVTLFRPFTHFGSLVQAAQASMRHKDFFKNVGDPIVLEVSLTYQDQDQITLQEWWDPQPMRLAFELLRYDGGKWKSIFQPAFDIYTEIMNSPTRPKGAPYTLDAEPLLQAMRQVNVKLIKYVNKVEGSGNETSFCVVDPQIITIKKLEI
jgi:hypothetical protein